MEKLVSIIIPVFKVEQYLDRCIESIINQTYKNLEIILVDDGSPDNCGEICDEWEKKDKRIKVVHKENGGISSARNAGLYIAKGEFICFVDSDDFIELNYVEKLVEKQKETNADLVYCRFFKTNEKGEKKPVIEEGLKELVENKKIENYYFGGKFLVGGYVWRCLYSFNIIKEIVFDVKAKYCEDLLFNTEIILEKNPQMALIEDCLYNYYENPISITRVITYENTMKLLYTKNECAKLLENYNREYLANSIRYQNILEELELTRFGERKSIEELLYIKYNTYENYYAYKKLKKEKFFKKIKTKLVVTQRWGMIRFLLKIKRMFKKF